VSDHDFIKACVQILSDCVPQSPQALNVRVVSALRWTRLGRFVRCLCVGLAVLQEQQELTQPTGTRANSGQLSGKSFGRQCVDSSTAMQAATPSQPSMVKTDLK
jgi:hypothetical protein